MPKQNKKEDKELFVQIEYPIEFRKDLLESSRDTIRLLQSLEKIRLIRIEKEKEILKLKRQLNELKKILLFLKSKFPKSEGVMLNNMNIPQKNDSINSKKRDKINKTKNEKIKNLYTKAPKKIPKQKIKSNQEKISEFMNEENKIDVDKLSNELEKLEEKLNGLKNL